MGKRGIAGVATLDVPFDTRSRVRIDPQLRCIYASLLQNVKLVQKKGYLLEIQQTFKS